MKTQNTNKLAFGKSSIIELQNSELAQVNGGTAIGGECFLCIRTSNGPGATVLEDLKIA